MMLRARVDRRGGFERGLRDLDEFIGAAFVVAALVLVVSDLSHGDVEQCFAFSHAGILRRSGVERFVVRRSSVAFALLRMPSARRRET